MGKIMMIGGEFQWVFGISVSLKIPGRSLKWTNPKGHERFRGKEKAECTK
jgi:hypothetical protein